MKYKKIRPKKSKFKDHKILYIFILFLFMGIGYAALTTSLSINGTTNVATNTWNIHFENLNVVWGSVEATAPTITNNSISYSAELSKPGDYYEFYVEVKNDGTLPGKISLVELTGNSTNYLNTSYSYTSGLDINVGDILDAGKYRRITVKVWIPDDIDTSLLPTSDTPITLTFNLQYVQSEHDRVVPNPCTFDGELEQGAEYVNGQYTYRYMQERTSSGWTNITDDGWGAALTDRTSTDPVTTNLCTSINNKPIVSMAYMFYNSKATSIDVSSFDTSEVVSMRDMFFYTDSLKEIDLSNFNTTKVNDFIDLFYGSNIEHVDFTGFDTKKAKDNMRDMIYYAPKVKKLDLSSLYIGMSGTRMLGDNVAEILTPTYVDKMENWYYKSMFDDEYNIYSHLSTSPKNYVLKSYPNNKVIKFHTFGGTIKEKGMLVSKTATNYPTLPTPTKEGREFLGWSTSSSGSPLIDSSTSLSSGNFKEIYAVWSNPKARLLGGSSFRSAITSLSGDNSTYNTAIKEIRRSDTLPNITLGSNNIISTSDSEVPIYAWFDNGTIYYYSTEEKLYMNKSSSYMFQNLQGLEAIDISSFDSSEVYYYSYMFSGCSSLKKLYISNFNTEDGYDFFDMFSNCTSLEELDISNFDLHYSESSDFFTNDTSLKKLKTPKRSTSKGHPNYLKNLPVPMVDSDGNVYTVLNGYVPTQTWIESQS